MTPSETRAQEGGVALRVATFLCASIVFFAISKAAVVAAYVLVVLTIAFAAVFVVMVFSQSRPRSSVLVATWAMVIACVILNFASLYAAESRSDPHAFSANVSSPAALELSFGAIAPGGIVTAEPKSELATIEHASEAILDITILALSVGGVVAALATRRP